MKKEKIDGDKILAMLGERWKRKNILKRWCCRYINVELWIRKFFKINGIKFLRSDVGDRYVKEKMKKINLI